MTAELAARAGGPAECVGVEVEYVDADRGRERRPLAACWSERVSPVRGFASFRGSRTGRAGGGSPAPASTSVVSRGRNGTWLPIAAMARNLVRAAGSLASLPFAKARAATVRRDLIVVAARTARHGRGHVTLHLPEGWHRERE
jgi:hypothetical protein